MLHLPSLFESLIAEAPHRVRLLRHVDPSSILVLTHPMGSRKQGQNAGLRHARQGKVFAPVFPDVRFREREIRYAISFHPAIVTGRMEQCDDPIEVVMHELWHIGAKCDGKLRPMRHGVEFNRIVKGMVKDWYRSGGAELPRVESKERVMTRYWKGRQVPQIAYVRRGLLERVAIEMARINWQERWDEAHIIEKPRRMSSLIPVRYAYVCPNGHRSTSGVRYRSPRSCAQCSSRFDERYLLMPAGERGSRGKG